MVDFVERGSGYEWKGRLRDGRNDTDAWDMPATHARQYSEGKHQ